MICIFAPAKFRRELTGNGLAVSMETVVADICPTAVVQRANSKTNENALSTPGPLFFKLIFDPF
jgi:hypothetical protein